MPEKLLHKYFPDQPARDLVTIHSRLVAAKALLLAKELSSAVLDLQFMEEAALLHDIGICRTNAPGLGCFGDHHYICHGIIGREILEREGMPQHAMLCERHIGVGLTISDITRQGLPLPLREMVPVTAEEKLICIADLFYSKKPSKVNSEKSFAKVRTELARFGPEKVETLDLWLSEFNLNLTDIQ